MLLVRVEMLLISIKEKNRELVSAQCEQQARKSVSRLVKGEE